MKPPFDFLRVPGASTSADALHARILGDIDGLAIQERHVLSNCEAMNPKAFETRRDRRIGDAQIEGVEINEYTNTDQIVTGNADIVCESGDAAPDESTNTLPIYPQDLDLPPNVNAGQSRSIVGSDNDLIARSTSILIGFVADPRNLTPSQALDVVR